MKSLLSTLLLLATATCLPSSMYMISTWDDDPASGTEGNGGFHLNQYYNPTHEPHTVVNMDNGLSGSNSFSAAIGVGSMISH